MIRRVLLATALSVTLATPALAWKRVTVTDGDTVVVSTSGMATGLRARLSGIDTPEMNGRCPEEQALANVARGRLIELTRDGVEIESALDFDRYGRVLVVLRDRSGRNINDQLVAEGLARRYDGRGPRQPWCPAR